MALNLVGFDSAWGDNPRKPGAICALRLQEGEAPQFEAPRPADFNAACVFIRDRHRPDDTTIVAIDQPTIVPNMTGARPAERVVAALMSFSGGGIQPAFRGKADLFGDGAPIWRFLDRLGFVDDPVAASRAEAGGFVMEVFPALALLALDPSFMARPRCGPRYNPSRTTFRLSAWVAVCDVMERESRQLGFNAAAAWCAALDRSVRPRKAVQDGLDALVCCLVAVRWRRARDSCMMVGALGSGYVVAPVSPVTRAHLARAAEARGVPAT